MLIAQVSDLHLHADPQHVNLARFSQVIDDLLAIEPVPDLLVLSGDLSQTGEEASYLLLKQALERWRRPFQLMMGNHDRRDHLERVFPRVLANDGFVQSALAEPGLGLIFLDTSAEGREGGAFCERRAAWLRAQLDRARTGAVVLFTHHPPIELGVQWVDPAPTQAWVQQLGDTVQGRNVVAICSGHVHMAAVGQWNGIPVVCCPSSSSQLSLVFATMDADRPDGRPLMGRGQPAFALHRWLNGRFTSLFGSCTQELLVRWNEETQDLVARMMAERIE